MVYALEATPPLSRSRKKEKKEKNPPLRFNIFHSLLWFLPALDKCSYIIHGHVQKNIPAAT